MSSPRTFLVAPSLLVVIAGCGAEPEARAPGRTALGGAPNPVFVSGTATTEATGEFPELEPGESFILVEGLSSGVRALRPTHHLFDGSCTNLYGSGDFGEDFPDAAPADEGDVATDDVIDDGAADPDAPAAEAPGSDAPSLLPDDDLLVHLHLMPPLGEQPVEGAVIEHVLAEDTVGTYVVLSDFTSATTVQLARAKISVGAEVGGRHVFVEGETEDGVRVVAGYRLAAGETW